MATKNEIQAHDGTVSSCQFGGIGDELILTASHDGGVRLWKEDSLLKVGEYQVHSDGVCNAKFGSYDAKIYSGGWDRQLCCTDLETQRLIWRGKHLGMVTWVDVRGHCVATVSDPDLVLRLWDIRSERCVHQVFGLHDSTITSCSISDNEILTSSFDHTAKCYDLVSNKQTMTLKSHRCPILKGVVSNSSYVTAACDKTLCCWKMGGGHTIMQEGHHSCVSSCAFSSDGKKIFSVGFDQRVVLWDAHSCSLLDYWTFNCGMLYDVNVGTQNTLLLASGNGKIYIKPLSQPSKSKKTRKQTVRMECRSCHVAFMSTEIIGDQCVDCRLQRLTR